MRALVALFLSALLCAGAAGQTVPATFPNLSLAVNGTVTATVRQADGKLIIGGSFSLVDGVPRTHLARLNTNGSLDLTWDPALSGSFAGSTQSGITALAASSSDVFVAGSFSRVGQVEISGLAKISLATGEADAAWHPDPNGRVSVLLLRGSSLYVAGDFRHSASGSIGRQSRHGIAKISTSGAGDADAGWDAGGGPDGPVNALANDGSHLYAGGSFTTFGGLTIHSLVKLPLTGTGAPVASWNPGFSPASAKGTLVRGLAVQGGGLYVCGDLYLPSGNKFVQRPLARLDPADGSSDPGWRPEPILPVQGYALAVSSTHAYLFGYFSGRGSLSRYALAGAGAPDNTWSPDLVLPAPASIRSLLVTTTALFTGGEFSQAGGRSAFGITRLSLTTGLADPKYRGNVQFPAAVKAIVHQPDGKVIIGGSFVSAAGFPRAGLARLELSGALDHTWNPFQDAGSSTVNALALNEDGLFVGGNFAIAGANPRLNLVKIDAGGALDPAWAPDLFQSIGNHVTDLAIAQRKLYAAGSSTSTEGVVSTGIFRIATDTGAVDPNWKIPAPDTAIRLQASGTNLYAACRSGTAENPGSYRLGRLLTETPQFAFLINAEGLIDPLHFAAGPSGLYALSTVATVGGASQNFLYRFDARTGKRDAAFKVRADVAASAVALGGRYFYVAGAATTPGNAATLRRIDLTARRLDPRWLWSADETQVLFPDPRGDVYAGGDFTRVNGVARLGLALLATADAPVITPTALGAIITRNPADGPEVTHFRITSIRGGQLFLVENVAPLAEGDFVSAERAAAGLQFQLNSGSPGGRLVVVSAVGGTTGAAGAASTVGVLGAAGSPPLFTFSKAAFSGPESAGAVSVEIRKSPGAPGSVRLSTSDGSALAGRDYTTLSQTLAFTAAETARIVAIPVVNDAEFKGDRAFQVRLTAVSPGASVLDPGQASVQIEDDDAIGATGSLLTIVPPDPATPPPSAGELSVALTPPGVGQWRLAGESQFRASGAVATGLVTGNYIVEFKPVSSGYQRPESLTTLVISGSRTNETGAYTALPGNPATGEIQVTIKPNVVSDPSVPVASRGQWRYEGDPTWRDSGTAVTVSTGLYIVEFKSIAGLFPPPNQTVQVSAAQTNMVVGSYFAAPPGAAPPPAALTLGQATTSAPYLYNGQVETAVGLSSGAVVQRHVVLTVAHALFDDRSLSYVPQARWFFQRHAGEYEPAPSIPRGWYVYAGYAEQRATDGADEQPGLSTAASQNLDLAAMYFLEPPGRGGHGGYLSSDAANNEWLTTAREKLLVGYPVEAVPDASRGKMHATSPANLAFTRVYQPTQRVYATDGIAGLPGMSGGPLYARHENGNFYPAAVYLGGTAQTLVRAIDSPAVSLINRAETSGNGGGNNTGGGITVISPGETSASSSLGILACNLSPPNAEAAGAGWRVVGEENYHPRDERIGVQPGVYPIEFKTVPGFLTPAARNVEAHAGQTVTFGGTYVVASPPAITSSRQTRGTVGFAFGYRIVATNNTTSYSATGLPPDLNVNPNTGFITGTPSAAGVFEGIMSATNSVDTRTAPLTITIAMPGTLTVSVDGAGSVTPGFEGVTLREIGKRLTVVATPAPGMLFDGWTGSLPSVARSLAFPMADGLDLHANFIQDPFPALRGTYTGILKPVAPQTTPAGLATATVSPTGAITINTQFRGARSTRRGQLSHDRAFAAVLRNSSSGPLAIALQLDLTGRLTGSLTEGATAVASLEATAGVLASTERRFTAVFSRPLDNALPPGHGSGSILVKTNGALQFRGTLGDSRKLTQNSRLRAGGDWPFFVPLQGGRGSVSGDILLGSSAPGTDLEGGVTWFQPPGGAANPAGFSAALTATGSAYARPAAGQRALATDTAGATILTIGGDDLPAGLPVLNFTFPPTAAADLQANRQLLTSPEGARLTLTLSTGIFTGSYLTAPGGPNVAFSGAVLQKTGAGAGHASAPGGKLGFVELAPAP